MIEESLLPNLKRFVICPKVCGRGPHTHRHTQTQTQMLDDCCTAKQGRRRVLAKSLTDLFDIVVVDSFVRKINFGKSEAEKNYCRNLASSSKNRNWGQCLGF